MIRGNSPVLPLLRSAVDASERAAGLTYQLLAYSGKGRFVIAPLNILELAEKISDLVLHSAPKAVELRIEPNPSLPAVQADASQIQQVIMNLVINGAEAIGERPGSVTLRGGTRHLSAEEIATDFQLFRIKPGEYVWLEVRDNGCGMDAATRKQIFEPFFTTKFTGRGLGLAAVLGIVRGHNGALCVESTKGVGSVFTVYLPVSKEAAIQVENSFRADLSGSGLVLIVDDEDLVRATAVGALKHYGYEVVQAQDGWEAIRQFDRHEGRFSLVILDVTMPVMSGEHTLLRLREKDPDVRVLLTSGYSETEAVKRFAGKGISGFLQKPYTSKTLAEKVRAYARRAQDSV
jgi:CheY-like chemotaxis protein